MKGVQLDVLMGLLLPLGLLTGCALFPPTSPVDEVGLSGSSGWITAAQGAEEPQVCAEDLSRREVRQEVKETLGEEEEAQALQQALASLGKRVMVWRAQGCTVQEDEETLEGQELQALGDEEGTTLMEVPAGRDAALYMVKSGDEGNYWVSLKERAEGGERLVHIEVGLESEGDAEVQGLGKDMGQVSFFLPDEEGTQEIAEQVQELLLEDSKAEGLRAMALDEELDWSRTEVVILEDGSTEESDALLVIPSTSAEGQRLWGRRRPAIDVESALHVRIKVQRISSGKGHRWSYRIVRPTPERPQVRPVIKRGRELKKAFKYCPYRYYGRLSSFRRELCRKYEDRWWKKRWEYRVRPKLYKGVLQTYNRIDQLLGQREKKRPGIALFPDPKVSVLTAGFRDLSPETVDTLRKLVLEKGYLHADDVEGQGLEFLCVNVFGITIPNTPIVLAGFSICASDVYRGISFLADLVSQLAQEEGKSEEEIYAQLAETVTDTVRQCALDPGCDIYEFFLDGPLSTDPVMDVLVKSIRTIIENKTEQLQNDLYQIKVAIWAITEFSKRVSDREEAELLLREFGPAPVLGIGWFETRKEQGQLDPSQINSALTHFPYEDFLNFFRDLKGLLDYADDHPHNSWLRGDVRNLALSFVLYGIGNTKEDLESFYRVQSTVQMTLQILHHNQDQEGQWVIERLGFDLRETGGKGQIDLIISGQFEFHLPGGNQVTQVVGYIIIEPFLEADTPDKQDDYDLLVKRILDAINYATLNYGHPYERKPVMLIVLHGAASGALSSICGELDELRIKYGPCVRIIVILDGQVVCQSSNISPEDAQRLCEAMGVCQEEAPTSAPATEREDTSYTVVGGSIPICGEGSSQDKHAVCI